MLINANVLALALVLILVEVGDLGAVAAWWNVGHARDMGGRGAALDVCYLQGLGSPGLLPLLRVERTARDQLLRERAAVARRSVLTLLELQQRDWHSWTWRGSHRLSAAQAAVAVMPPERADLWRKVSCDGLIAQLLPAQALLPSAAPPVVTTPLTTGAHP